MKSKWLCIIMALLMTLTAAAPGAYAFGMKEATASFLVPTTGQAMNGQIGNTKTKIMGGVEVAAITTVAILGGLVGGGVIWAGLGPLIANHAWSSIDAYRSAQYKRDPMYQQQMLDAQRTLDLSRQRRFEREQMGRSSIRDRIMLAGEEAGS
ncbi:MAG: hypothetical protein NC930_01645 [Candidatus Omnitrophica bacterium]|nr:hypothetical protein [Candidatus Omnitrophota bacterium]